MKKLSIAISILALVPAFTSHSQNVGVGLATPTAKLHVDQPTNAVRGLRIDKAGTEDAAYFGLTNGAGGYGNAIEVSYNSNTVGSSAIWVNSWGGFGSLNIDNYGDAFGTQVWNRLVTNTNATMQLTQDGLGYGLSISTDVINNTDALYVLQDGTGLAGDFYSTSGAGISVYGGSGDATYSLSETGQGVYGYSNDASATSRSGIYGRATSFSGVTGSNGAGSTYGVFSFGDFGGTGAKYFVIDHPLDPENKTLKHFNIESDEPMLIYRGKAVFDANGKATIELADYVMAINTDFTYNLTSIGQHMPVFIENEVNNDGQFTIGGGVAGEKVAWVVYGMRNDAYMQANPEKLNIESDKPAGMAGKYLDPTSHGQPLNMGVDYNGTVDEGTPVRSIEKGTPGRANEVRSGGTE